MNPRTYSLVKRFAKSFFDSRFAPFFKVLIFCLLLLLTIGKDISEKAKTKEAQHAAVEY